MHYQFCEMWRNKEDKNENLCSTACTSMLVIYNGKVIFTSFYASLTHKRKIRIIFHRVCLCFHGNIMIFAFFATGE